MAEAGESLTKLDDLVQQRSMLVILLAASRTAHTAFTAAHNPVDAELRSDLTTMIERTEAELVRLDHAIQALS